MSGYPQAITPTNHVEPVPRRIRAELGGRVVLDTNAALYLWEWPYYPQYQIPVADVDPAVLVEEDRTHALKRGTVSPVSLRVADVVRDAAGRRYRTSSIPSLVDTVRFEWDALDAWYEEDERVFVHPRSPYVRVDALRSTRHVRVARDGVTLAESGAPVMVFETGLPTRCYFDPGAVDVSHLRASDTVTSCPYKGRTSAYWSVAIEDHECPDLAWRYDFSTRQLLPVAGLIAFYDEQVDVTIDGVEQPRPRTHFFS